MSSTLIDAERKNQEAGLRERLYDVDTNPFILERQAVSPSQEGHFMPTVISKDGTTIAYERTGEGPVLIRVDGATATRQFSASFAEALAPRFTVITYDRRGRGDSGDTQPYAVQREIEDIHALIDSNGGLAFVMGQSSGAVLALRAAAAGLPITKLAVYEPPFLVNDSRAPVPGNYVDHLNSLIAEDKREEAVAYFSTVSAGIPEEFLEQMKQSPYWQPSIEVAHTISYDGMVMADTMSGKPLAPEPWSAVSVPTLVMSGGETFPWIHDGAAALMEHLPNAEYRLLPGQGHGAADDVLAPVLVEFFLDQSGSSRHADATQAD